MDIELNEPYGFIYITTNMINGKRYIGQKKFMKDWEYYLGSGIALKKAIIKYGRDNFIRDIVAFAYSKDELNKLEIEWIHNYNAVESNYFYNISKGGDGFEGIHSEETKLKIRQAVKGKKKGNLHHMWGKKQSQETIHKIKITTSLKLSGKNHPMYGKHWNNEVKDEISQSLKEYFKTHDNPNKGKKFECYSGIKHPNATMVICLTTVEVFDYIEPAKEKYHTNDIGRACKGKLKSTGRHPITGERLQWKYIKDLTPEEYIKYDIDNKLKELHNQDLVQAC